VARASVALATLALASACTPAHDDRQPGPTASTTQSPTASIPEPSPTASPSHGVAQTAGDAPLVDALEAWTTLAGPSDEMLTVTPMTATRIGAVVQDGSGQQSLVLLGPGTRVGHEVPAGQIIQHIYPVGDDIVFDTGEDITGHYWISRWNPESDEVDLLYSSTGADPEWSESAIQGTRLYLTSRGHDGTDCVKEMDLTSPTPGDELTEIACVAPGVNIGWLIVTGHTLSFLSGDPTANECPALHRVRLPDGQDEVVAVDGCISRGFIEDSWAVWTEPPPIGPSGSVDFAAELRVQVDGEMQTLGTAVNGSTVICDDSLLWTWYDAEPPIGPSEIRRWKPGGPVEVLYRSPDRSVLEAYSTSTPTCASGAVGFQRFGWHGDSGQEYLMDRDLGWTADVHPSGSTS
jgi:hypothetical protein